MKKFSITKPIKLDLSDGLQNQRFWSDQRVWTGVCVFAGNRVFAKSHTCMKKVLHFFHKSALLFREKCFYFLEKSVFFNFLEKSEALFSKKLKTWFLISEYLVISLSLYTNLYI